MQSSPHKWRGVQPSGTGSVPAALVKTVGNIASNFKLNGSEVKGHTRIKSHASVMLLSPVFTRGHMRERVLSLV